MRDKNRRRKEGEAETATEREGKSESETLRERAVTEAEDKKKKGWKQTARGGRDRTDGEGSGRKREQTAKDVVIARLTALVRILEILSMVITKRGRFIVTVIRQQLCMAKETNRARGESKHNSVRTHVLTRTYERTERLNQLLATGMRGE